MKLLKFEAVWCKPCSMLTAMLGEAREFITMPIEVIDIENNNDMVIKYGIRSVPTMVVVDDDGEVLKRRSGLLSTEDLIEFLKA